MGQTGRGAAATAATHATLATVLERLMRLVTRKEFRELDRGLRAIGFCGWFVGFHILEIIMSEMN